MAHRATVFSPNDVARLRKLATGLTEFVAKLDGQGTKPAVAAPAKKKKPTGAAAHKAYLAKQAAKGGKKYPPVVLDDQQKQQLKEMEEKQAVPA